MNIIYFRLNVNKYVDCLCTVMELYILFLTFVVLVKQTLCIVRNYNDPCNGTDDCQGHKVECIEGRCRCSPDYNAAFFAPSSKTKFISCVKNSQYKDMCDDDTMCPKGLICRFHTRSLYASKCLCLDSSGWNGSTCVPGFDDEILFTRNLCVHCPDTNTLGQYFIFAVLVFGAVVTICVFVRKPSWAKRRRASERQTTGDPNAVPNQFSLSEDMDNFVNLDIENSQNSMFNVQPLRYDPPPSYFDLPPSYDEAVKEKESQM